MTLEGLFRESTDCTDYGRFTCVEYEVPTVNLCKSVESVDGSPAPGPSSEPSASICSYTVFGCGLSGRAMVDPMPVLGSQEMVDSLH